MARPDGPGAERLRALGERYRLPDRALEQLRLLIELLAEDPRAPSAIKDRPRIVDDHLADSLVALELDQVRGSRALVDIGSGAGFPALPLAIALPRASVTALESSERKCRFVERATAACGIGNVEVVQARAEGWPEGLGTHDVATARALAPLEVVVEYAAPLLSIGGNLVAWRGKREPEAEAAAARAAAKVGMKPGPVLPVAPYDGASNRYLHLISKVMDTPEGFPRRPGMAAKRPLSGLSRRSGSVSDRVRR